MRDSHDLLENLVKGVSDAQVSFARPSPEPAEGTGVSLCLLDLRGGLSSSPARQGHHQLQLGYLVTAWAAEPVEAQQLLVDVCFAAMEQPGMEVDLDPPGAELWQALGVPPQPSFRITVPLRRRRPEHEVKPVLKPLVVQSAALVTLSGVVRTADDTAVPQARVDIPNIDRTATTDRRGRFQLDGVPSDGGPLRIRVRARGREVTREVTERDDRSFVVITLNPTEAVDG
ncbi:hypothetical protein BH23CHL6_BH23CHL6_01170 [soil metagenome]